MTPRDVRVTDLVGRRVRDSQGRSIGRIEELICEIELRPDGRGYVVKEFHVGALAFLEAMGGSTLLRALHLAVGRGSGYTRYRVPWAMMDLADPEHPRVRVPREQLTTG